MHVAEHSKSEKLNISILAGNSRVSRDDETGHITVQAQVAAFRAALSRAIEIKNLTGQLPSISIALDHRGTFRKQFLLDGLTNSQKRHPKLSQLHPEIVAVFQPFADELGIPLCAIAIIHEDSARTHASHVIETGDLPFNIKRLMKVDEDSDDEVSNADPQPDQTHSAACSVGSSPAAKVTCAAVTTEYFLSSVDKQSGSLEVYFENDIWSQPNVYTRGAVLMKELGSQVDVRLRIVDKLGNIFGAKKASALPARVEPTSGNCSQMHNMTV